MMGQTDQRLLGFTKIQGMTLIVMDDDLPCVPRCRVDVLHQLDTICLELGREVRYAVGLKVEVEVLALVNIRD
jgi:hypothetical protein